MPTCKIGLKRKLTTALLTVLLGVLLSPIYTDMLTGFIASRTNNTAVVRILAQDKTLDIADEAGELTVNKDSESVRLSSKINSRWNEISVHLKALRDGKATIVLSGPDKTDAAYPLIVDYTDFTVNGRRIFADVVRAWTTAPYEYVLTFKAGEKIKLNFKSRKHHFNFTTLKTAYKFDFSLFLSTLIIAFLISYKAVCYVAQFKLEQHNSRIDIAFVTVFIIMLFLPMSYISSADRSDKENRMLTKYQPLFVNGSFNLKYGEAFEQWFNDRFFGRKLLMHAWSDNLIRLNRYGQNSKAGIYKDEWLLNSGELYSEINDKELTAIGQGIAAYDEFCKSRNIKCYIMLLPRKLEFIKDKTFRIVPETEQDKAAVITRFAKEKYNYDIIYPMAEFDVANKEDMIFFKTDHHWTEWGAYTGYKALMKRIAQDFPRFKTVKDEDFDVFYNHKAKGDYDKQYIVGSTCMLLHLKDKDCPLHTRYKYYQSKYEKNLHVERDNDTFAKNFYFPSAPNPQKAMIIGNSFIENFAVFLPYTFKRSFNRRANDKAADNLNLSRWKDEIIKNKVDIVVILLNSEYSGHLRDLKE